MLSNITSAVSPAAEHPETESSEKKIVHQLEYTDIEQHDQNGKQQTYKSGYDADHSKFFPGGGAPKDPKDHCADTKKYPRQDHGRGIC